MEPKTSSRTLSESTHRSHRLVLGNQLIWPRPAGSYERPTAGSRRRRRSTRLSSDDSGVSGVNLQRFQRMTISGEVDTRQLRVPELDSEATSVRGKGMNLTKPMTSLLNRGSLSKSSTNLF